MRVIDISLGRIFIDAGKAEQETLQVNRLYDMALLVRAGYDRHLIR